MRSILIRDTTGEEREQIVNEKVFRLKDERSITYRIIGY